MRLAASAFALLLAIASAPAQSENWRQLRAGEDAAGYVDTDAIERKGDKVRFWREIRFPEPRTAPTGHRFDRMSALIEVSCRAKTFRYLRQRAKLGDRLIYDGKDENDSAHAIAPGTNVDAELRAVCFDDWPGGK